jgi:hypothetical protein
MPLRNRFHERLPRGFHTYLVGLSTSITGNVPAYGYSIVTTSALAALTAERHMPDVLDAFLYLAGAGTAFSLLGAAGAFAFEEEEIGQDKPVTVLLGGAMSIFSASGGFGLAILLGHVLQGWEVWLLAPFAATLGYVVLLAGEMGVAHRLRR